MSNTKKNEKDNFLNIQEEQIKNQLKKEYIQINFSY